MGIGLWWLVSVIGIAGIPSPWAVIAQFGELVANGQLFRDAGASLARVFVGFFIGVGIAIPIGFSMGWYDSARAIFQPYIQFFRVIPPLAIIPLAIVTMGIGETPKVFVISLAAFLVSVVSTYQGVVNVDSTLIRAARVLGASDLTIFRRIVIPASVPFILVGARTGLGAAWATLVAAELIAAQSGLGFRMQQAQLFYDLPTIFVSLITIGILGLIMDKTLLGIERRFTRWM